VLANASEKDMVLSTLRTLEPEYKVHKQDGVNHQWKLYRADSPYTSAHTTDYPMAIWPFVDIFYFEENATHIWDDQKWKIREFVIEKKKVFPILRRPFSHLWLPVPCDTKAFLETLLGDIRYCQSMRGSHKRDVTIPFYKWQTVLCSDLHACVPFVHRSELNRSHWEEALRIGAFTQHRLAVKKSACEQYTIVK
jgi:hypothetical protein